MRCLPRSTRYRASRNSRSSSGAQTTPTRMRWTKWWCGSLAPKPCARRSAASSPHGQWRRSRCGRASSTWPQRRSTTQAARQRPPGSSTRGALLELEVAVLDHLGPLLHFALHHLAERLRRATRDLRAERRQSRPHLGHLQRPIDLTVERVYDVARHLRRPENREEGSALHRVALLGKGGRLRQERE